MAVHSIPLNSYHSLASVGFPPLQGRCPLGRRGSIPLHRHHVHQLSHYGLIWLLLPPFISYFKKLYYITNHPLLTCSFIAFRRTHTFHSVSCVFSPTPQALAKNKLLHLPRALTNQPVQKPIFSRTKTHSLPSIPATPLHSIHSQLKTGFYPFFMKMTFQARVAYKNFQNARPMEKQKN